MIKEILEQHALEVAFLWCARDVAAAAAHTGLPAIEDLDERIDAHLDGLRIAGDDGWASVKRALAAEEAGEIFAAAALAAEQGDAARLDVVLDAAGDAPALGRGVSSALGWVPFEKVEALITALLGGAGRPAAHRRVGLAAWAAHRRDPGAALTNALFEAAPEVRARALRAAGELGRIDLLPHLVAELGAEARPVRLWAAWSAALLGDAAAPRVLWALAEEGGPGAERACDMAARTLEPRGLPERLRSLAARPEDARTAVIGAGALGDPAVVPFLLEAMGDPALARIAGASFTAVTGIGIERALAGGPPAGFRAAPSDDAGRDDVALDPDAWLRWPALDAVAGRWSGRAEGLPRGVRHLLGEPIARASLRRVLRDGNQRLRAGAAIELARGGEPLFEVRGPGARQRRAIEQLG
jgi:uncharacterized protein (TIGR02270 family)